MWSLPNLSTVLSLVLRSRTSIGNRVGVKIQVARDIIYGRLRMSIHFFSEKLVILCPKPHSFLSKHFCNFFFIFMVVSNQKWSSWPSRALESPVTRKVLFTVHELEWTLLIAASIQLTVCCLKETILSHCHYLTAQACTLPTNSDWSPSLVCWCSHLAVVIQECNHQE